MPNKLYLFCASMPFEAREHSSALLFEGSRRFFSLLGEETAAVKTLPSGKPVFSRRERYLSVSHSGGAFLAAFSTLPVGVDLEKRGGAHPKLVKRYCTASEKTEDFYAVWTKKEAVSKIGGEGIAALSRIFTDGDRAELGEKRFRLVNLEKELPLKGYAAHAALPDLDGEDTEIEVIWL